MKVKDLIEKLELLADEDKELDIVFLDKELSEKFDIEDIKISVENGYVLFSF